MGPATLEAFSEFGGAYLAVVGGAAALETTWIEAIEDVDMDDLHPECLVEIPHQGLRPAAGDHGFARRLAARAGQCRRRAARRAAVLQSIGAA